MSRALMETGSSTTRLSWSELHVVMDHLNAGTVQLGLFVLVFAGLQIWWMSSTLLGRRLAGPMNEQEFKRRLQRIWVRD
jgi:hypothetical protein